MRGIAEYGAQTNAEHDEEHDSKSLIGILLLFFHELHVDIVLLLAGGEEAVPGFLLMVKAGMYDNGDNCCETETKLQREGGRYKQRRVFLIYLLIQSKLWGNDTADIVNITSVVVRVRVID